MHEPVQLGLARERDDERELERDAVRAVAIERRLQHLRLDRRRVRGHFLEQRPVALEPCWAGGCEQSSVCAQLRPLARRVTRAHEQEQRAGTEVDDVRLCDERVEELNGGAGSI